MLLVILPQVLYRAPDNAYVSALQVTLFMTTVVVLPQLIRIGTDGICAVTSSMPSWNTNNNGTINLYNDMMRRWIDDDTSLWLRF
jgi:hypothetical protein